MEKQTRSQEEISAETKKLARERALVILQVRSGMLTAREGAQRLGVSRKTYYEWEERALEAMALALENRPVGRPSGSMDEEKEDLRRHIRELEKKLDLAEKTIEVKELLAAYDSFKDIGSKKKQDQMPADRQEAIRRVVQIVEEVKERTGMPYGVICKAMRLPLASFNRWRWRLRNHVVVTQRPGPKKVEPFDPAVLDSEIRLLDHGVKRSAGTIQLYRRNAQSVSRRELARVVAQVRHDLESDRRRSLRHIDWLTPRMVWAMDMAEYDLEPIKTYLHNTQDLGSRYKFPPIAGGYPVGEEIAGYLSHAFSRFGPPLFLKRDNGGNMNHAVVNDVLAEFFVLPLNSPAYHAPYNGAIEESQREVKECFREKLTLGMPDYRDHVSAYAEAAVTDLNHRPRPCLDGKTSCQAFFESGRKTLFSKRDRKEIHDWLMERVERILSEMKESGRGVRESAWRIAVESWLQSQKFIRIHMNQKCHPIFSSF